METHSLLRLAPLGAAFLALAPAASAQILDPSGTPNLNFPNFHAWFDAGDGVNGAGQPPDGSPVTLWVDRTGKAHDLKRTAATSVDQPTFKLGLAHGRPAVAFDGSDYIWADGATEFGTLAAGSTIFVAVRVGAADGGYVFDSADATNRNALYTGDIPSIPNKWCIFTGNFPVVSGPTPELGIFQVHALSVVNSAQEHRIDGVTVKTSSNAAKPLQGFTLGARYSLGWKLKGDVAEVLVYDTVLSAADRAAVEGYLFTKYPPVRRVATPGAPMAAAAGDFDLDGDGDLAVPIANNTLAVFLGNGAGGFGAAATVAGTSPAAAAVAADFDADRKLDLVTAHPSTTELQIWGGLGTGSFSPPVGIPSGSGATAVTAADLDGNGLLDLVSVNETGNNVTVHLAIPAGGFAAPVPYAVGTGPRAAAAADWNGDGKADLAIANYSSQDLSLLPGVGGGAFGPAQTLQAGTPPVAVAVADLNLDGLADLATANDSTAVGAVVFLASVPGVFTPQNFALGAAAADLRVADQNRDGFPDLMATTPAAGTLSTVLGGPGGVFAPGPAYVLGLTPRRMAVADLDADGKMDWAVTNYPSKSLSVQLDGKATPQGLVPFGIGTPGCLGRLGNLTNSPAQPNNSNFAFTCTNAPPQSVGLGIAANAASFAGSDPLFLGVLFHVDLLGASELIPYDLVSDTQGNGWSPGVIPNNPLLVGLVYFTQAFFVEKPGFTCTSQPFGLVSSRGLQITIQ